MTYEEAYIEVCKGYKKGRPIRDLIEKYLYNLDDEEPDLRLSFYLWLIWACRKSHDDDSNPVLILCMAYYIKEKEYSKLSFWHDIEFSEQAAAAYSTAETVNMFSLDDNHPPLNIIRAAIRYLFNHENLDSIVSSVGAPWDMSWVSELPDCEVEYFSRKELLRLLKDRDLRDSENQCPF